MSGYSSSSWGGGMLCINGAAPTVVRCVFQSNTAQNGYGGALGCADASPRIEGCKFRENSAAEDASGGAVSCLRSRAHFEDCVFEDNYAGGNGGAMVIDQSPVVIEACEFRRNVADHYAGGIHILSGDLLGEATVSDCVFEENRAWGVGAILCYPVASPTITRCVIRGNHGGRGPGGISCGNHSNAIMSDISFIENSSDVGGGAVGIGSSSNPQLTGCLFLRNSTSSGGAALVATGAEPVFEGCTFVDNSCSTRGTFLYVMDASPHFNRCIVANHPPGLLIWCQAVSGLPFQPTFACTDISGNASGDWSWDCIADQAERDGNFSEDPRFCDPSSDDYTLEAGSPCLPGQHPGGWDCGLIGAYHRECGPTPTQTATWGVVKQLFR